MKLSKIVKKIFNKNSIYVVSGWLFFNPIVNIAGLVMVVIITAVQVIPSTNTNDIIMPELSSLQDCKVIDIGSDNKYTIKCEKI